MILFCLKCTISLFVCFYVCFCVFVIIILFIYIYLTIVAISSFLVKCTALLLYCIIIIVDFVYFCLIVTLFESLYCINILHKKTQI